MIFSFKKCQILIIFIFFFDVTTYYIWSPVGLESNDKEKYDPFPDSPVDLGSNDNEKADPFPN